MLIAKQLAGVWACSANHLRPICEICLGHLRSLRERVGSPNVTVQHVYREFNVDADGVCYQVLDSIQTTGASCFGEEILPIMRRYIARFQQRLLQEVFLDIQVRQAHMV